MPKNDSSRMRAGEQERDRDHDLGEDRDQGVAQHVARMTRASPQPLARAVRT